MNNAQNNLVASDQMHQFISKIITESMYISNHQTNELSKLYKVEAIKKISDYISQLRRVGKGHGKNG